MEANEHIRVVEINGVKLEVDLRTAKTIEHYRVGDRVKVLVKRYGETYDSNHGVIVAFDDFKKLPSITVCYISNSSTLEFAVINGQAEGCEIAPCNDDVMVEKGDIIATMDAEINRKRAEIGDLERKKVYFSERFARWFSECKEADDGKEDA